MATVRFVTAVAGAAYWLFGRDSGDDVGTLFTDLPPPSSCESGALAVMASTAHFAAFTDDRALAETGDKFIVADVSVRNDGSAPVSVTESGFYLAERPGERRPAAMLPAPLRESPVGCHDLGDAGLQRARVRGRRQARVR